MQSLRRHTFYEVEVAGRIFLGLAGTDPCIALKGPRGYSVQLGVCRIAEFATESVGSRYYEPGWWVAKYDTQRHIPLTGFSRADAERLGALFGIPVGRFGDNEDYRESLFDGSDAQIALGAWSKAHPRLSAQWSAHANYLHKWKERSQMVAAA